MSKKIIPRIYSLRSSWCHLIEYTTTSEPTRRENWWKKIKYIYSRKIVKYIILGYAVLNTADWGCEHHLILELGILNTPTLMIIQQYIPQQYRNLLSIIVHLPLCSVDQSRHYYDTQPPVTNNAHLKFFIVFTR